MVKFLCVLIPSLVVCPIADAQIYKCAGKGGSDLYQNFPCPIDSIGWKPTDVSGGKSIPTTNARGEVRSAETGTERADAQKPRLQPDAPIVGMNVDEVRAIWGQPAGDAIRGVAPMWRTSIGDLPVEVWTYGPTRTVQFDQKGHVSAVRK
jgi:hypothetical protein